MFNNIGTKLQKLAMVNFACGLILGVVLSCYMGFAKGNMALGFGLLIGLPIVGYIEALIIFGFGNIVEAAENVKNIDNNLFVIASNESDKATETSVPAEEKQD